MKRARSIKTRWISPRWFNRGTILLTVLIFAGCSGSFGWLRPSPEITGIFRQKQILSEYNYYYTGRAAIPYAVVGIRKDYVLDLKFWKPVKIQDGQKENGQLAGLIDRLYGSDFKAPRGAEIVDPDGNVMGIWFSVYTMTRIKFGPDKQVNVFSPYTPSRHSRINY